MDIDEDNILHAKRLIPEIFSAGKLKAVNIIAAALQAKDNATKDYLRSLVLNELTAETERLGLYNNATPLK